MSTGKRQRAATVGVGFMAALALVFSGIAIAGSIPDKEYAGGALIQTKIVAEADGVAISDAAKGWTDVRDAQVHVSVPSGKSRLIVATFNAETSCSTGGEQWCALRIVAKKPGGSVQQMYPRAGSEFAFDSGGGEEWEGNTAIRSLKIGSGDWTVWVQAMVFGTGGYGIDDWHFQVDVHRS